MINLLDPLSEEEREEMVALKRAINDGPSCVAPQKMERFSELFVRSIQGKGDTITNGFRGCNASS